MFRTAFCTSGKGGAGGKTTVTGAPKGTGKAPASNVKNTAVPKVTKRRNAPRSNVR